MNALLLSDEQQQSSTKSDKLTPLRVRKRTQGQRLRRGERKYLKRQFLIEFAQHPVIDTACKRVGISRSGFYQWLRTDDRFKTKYDALVAAHYDIWLWSTPEEWEAHLKRRKQGHRLIRYYLKRDIQTHNFQTMKDVRREQRRYKMDFGTDLENEEHIR